MLLHTLNTPMRSMPAKSKPVRDTFRKKPLLMGYIKN